MKYSVLQNHTEIFRDAEVAIFVVNQYKKGLKVALPNHELEVMVVPPEGYWGTQVGVITLSATKLQKKLHLSENNNFSRGVFR